MSEAKRALVVDDSNVSRRVAGVFLEKAGYEVTTACDGQEALEKVKAQRPDVIVLDFMMPRLDGAAVCRKLREDPATADIPVIMLTCRSDRGGVLEAAHAGANDYLVKPFKGDELVARITRLLSGE